MFKSFPTFQSESLKTAINESFNYCLFIFMNVKCVIIVYFVSTKMFNLKIN